MTRWSWIPTVLLLLSHPPAEATVVAASGPPEGEAVVLAVDGPAEEGYPWSRGGGPELGVGQSFRSSRALDLAAITVRAILPPGAAGSAVQLTLGEMSGPGDGRMDRLLWTGDDRLPASVGEGEALYLTFVIEDPSPPRRRRWPSR